MEGGAYREVGLISFRLPVDVNPGGYSGVSEWVEGLA